MTVTINWNRLFQQIEQINAISRLDDGSCCRLALTDADKAGRDMVAEWMRDIGLDVRVDRIGNIFGMEPEFGDTQPVMTGSHIDTVSTGGRFDGTYGVLSGLEAVRCVREAGIERERPFAIAVFTNEEGARFQPDMMGSLVHAGGLSLESALAAVDSAGQVLGDELKRIGYSGPHSCGEITPCAFIELHIEQGPILDAEGGLLGAVEDLQGIVWREVVIKGVSNHAGTTPMSMRRDALYCAARTAAFVRELALKVGGSQVATVGAIDVSPNLINVIAREARLSIDIRNTDESVLAHVEEQLDEFLESLVKDEAVQIDSATLVRTPPVQFDPKIIAAIEQAGDEMAAPVRRMTSGAGHDAQMMARICPAGMIFVPSINGISHNPREDTREEHLEIGANALLRTMLQLAG